MADRVSGRSHFNDLYTLIDHLQGLHDGGGWVHEVAPHGDHFTLGYSDSRGEKATLGFTLPPAETEYLTSAITAGYLGAHAVNSGSLRRALTNFSLRVPADAHPELRIDHVGGS